jgi:uncharacterized lipoprotein
MISLKLIKEWDMKTLIILAVLVVLAPACAFTPQAVVLKPEIQPTLGSTVQGRTVYLTVVDERPRQTLGTRSVKGVGAELTVAGDLTKVVRTSVADGLQRQGFVITSHRAADGHELRVEIRNLDYNVTQGFWAGTLRVECGLKAICIVGSARPYERLYRGEDMEKVQFVQGNQANEKYINNAISKAINSLLQDSELINCLAQKGQS